MVENKSVDLYKLVTKSNDPTVDPYDLVKPYINIHSTNVDDKILLDFFKDFPPGRFLVIGAHTGLDHSLQLLKLGWNGVYCEPNPISCQELIKNTSTFKNQVTILNIAITARGGLTDFYINEKNPWLSTTKSQWSPENALNRIIVVNAMKLAHLIELIGYDFSYVQTDTEGADVDIIKSFNWNKLTKCRMICTEAGPSVLKQLCSQAGYMISDRTPTNAFYTRNG